MKIIGILTGDPELGNFLSKIGKRKTFYPENKWFARLNDAVFYYLNTQKTNYNFVKITPEMIDDNIFKTVDFLFYNFLDPVAAKILSDDLYIKLLDIINKNPKKVHPPPKFANLIADKCEYYKYLQNKDIPIVPFFCISKDQYSEKTHNGANCDEKKKFVTNIYKKIQNNNWKQFIGKPILGTSSTGFKMFNDEKNVSIHEIKKQMIGQLDRVFYKHKFPKLLYQEAHTEFGNGLRPEIKMYYIGI